MSVTTPCAKICCHLGWEQKNTGVTGSCPESSARASQAPFSSIHQTLVLQHQPSQAMEGMELAHHGDKLMVTHPGHLAGSNPDPSWPSLLVPGIPCQGCPCRGTLLALLRDSAVPRSHPWASRPLLPGQLSRLGVKQPPHVTTESLTFMGLLPNTHLSCSSLPPHCPTLGKTTPC